MRYQYLVACLMRAPGQPEGIQFRASDVFRQELMAKIEDVHYETRTLNEQVINVSFIEYDPDYEFSRCAF